MEAARRKLFINALEGAFVQTGSQDMYQTLARIGQLMHRAEPVLRAAQSRESLDRYLASVTAAEEEWLDRFLPLLIALPQMLDGFVKQAIRATAATLPSAAVGRPVALTVEQRKIIVEFLYDLDRKGVTRGPAQTRAAQHLGFSKRTVQRAWRERAALPSTQLPTMEDILRLFKANN